MTAGVRCFAESATSAVASAPGCLPAGNGYLRARIRGALNLDVDWRNAELECQGEARPDGSGIRMSFAGPRRADGHRLRLVFERIVVSSFDFAGRISYSAPAAAHPGAHK